MPHFLAPSPVVARCEAGVHISVADVHGLAYHGDRGLFRTWLLIVGLALVGNSAYMGVAVPRYLRIRSARAFSAPDFDGWTEVLAARIVLLASMLTVIPICMRMTLGSDFLDDAQPGRVPMKES